MFWPYFYRLYLQTEIKPLPCVLISQTNPWYKGEPQVDNYYVGTNFSETKLSPEKIYPSLTVSIKSLIMLVNWIWNWLHRYLSPSHAHIYITFHLNFINMMGNTLTGTTYICSPPPVTYLWGCLWWALTLVLYHIIFGGWGVTCTLNSSIM